MSALLSIKTPEVINGLPFRWRAFVCHLVLSVIVISLACLATLLAWFPYPLYLLDGTLDALLTLAAVDVALGPVITLLVSSSGKSLRERLIDYSVVGLIQLGALIYGLTQIHEQRVEALVHVDKEFHLVSKSALMEKIDNSQLSRYQSMHVGMLLREDYIGLTEAAMNTKTYSPNEYHPLASEEIIRAQAPAEYVPETLLNKHGDQVIYKLVIGKKKHGIVVLSKEMRIIDMGLANL